MSKEFLHCLRIQFFPNHFEDERIDEVVEYCEKFGIKNVMLFINAEEYHVGHMTKEEAKPWLVTMKKARNALKAKGISVSLNPWIELGHLDRCRTLKEGQHFTTQMDFFGKECEIVACPLCENWREYFLDFYKYLITELEPDTVWVEDDFRLHNHGELNYGGCFCHLHMKRYNQKLGTNYTRDEFIDRLFRKKCDKKVRKAWLDVSRECMVELANEIGKTVKSLNLGTKVALMSSSHEWHALEGRDWHGIHKGLAQGGVMINRLHLPCYDEVSAKRYYFDFNKVPYVCRALLPSQTIIYPELENGAFSSFAKEARFLKFQLESAIPLCISGMTYDIYDFVGNGILHELKYGETIKGITPYLNGVKNLNLKYNSTEGIILPIDEKTVYNKTTKINSFYDLRPNECNFGAYLASLGFATKVSKAKKFVGKIIALSEGNVNNFTDAQLKDMFKNNYVIVEGGAIKALIGRDLGCLIGAKGYEIYYAEHNVHSYEEVAEGKKINGKNGHRATAFGKAGNYIKVDYENGDEGAVSFVYDYLGNKVGVGDKANKNSFVIPYQIDGLYIEQYNALRVSLLKEYVESVGVKYLTSMHSGVYCYSYKQKNQTVIIVVNSTEEDLGEISLKLNGYDYQSVYALSKKSGRKRQVKFVKGENNLTVCVELEHLSTQTIILR